MAGQRPACPFVCLPVAFFMCPSVAEPQLDFHVQVDAVDGTLLGLNASSFGFINARAALQLADLSSSARYRAALLLCCSGYGISEGSLAQLRGPHIHNVDEWLRRVAGLSRVAVSSCGVVATTISIAQQLLPVPHDQFHTIQLSAVDQTQGWNMWCVAIALRFARPPSSGELPAAAAINHIVIVGLANKVPYRCIQASCTLAQWVCDGLNALPFTACLRPEYQHSLHAMMATSKNVGNWDKATSCLLQALSASSQLAEQLSQRHASSATFVSGMLKLRALALLKPPADDQLWFQDEKGLVDNVMVVCCTATLMQTSVSACADGSTCWLALQRWAQLCGVCELAQATSCPSASHAICCRGSAGDHRCCCRRRVGLPFRPPHCSCPAVRCAAGARAPARGGGRFVAQRRRVRARRRVADAADNPGGAAAGAGCSRSTPNRKR